jgi:hypothetical protein
VRPTTQRPDLRQWIAAAIAVSGLAAGTAAAQDLAYTGGLQVSTGHYLFETRTNSLYLLSGLDLTAGRLRVGASIPVIVQSTPWITSGPVPLPSGGREAGELTRQMGRGQRRIVLPVAGLETQAGIGDPLLRGDAELLRDGPGRASLRIGVSAKAPVASVDDGFSTGAWDYGAGLSAFKQLGVHSASGEVGFWRFGDLDDLALNDAWSYGAAYGRTIGGGDWSVVVSASGFSAILPGESPLVQVGFGLGRLLSPRRALTITASFGVTDTAPDVSVGLGWRVG